MTQEPQPTFEPNIEEQLRFMLQALEMVRSTPRDAITPQVITSVIGDAKDKAIDNILEKRRAHYSNAERNIR